MDWVLLIAAATFLLNIMVVVVTGVMVVSRIERTTAVLGNDLLHLSNAISRIYSVYESLEERLRSAETRLTRLEGGDPGPR